MPETTTGSSSALIAGYEVSTGHFIDGSSVSSDDTFSVSSPIDWSPLANVARGTHSEVDGAVAAAQRAFPAWAELGPEGRHPILSKFADIIQANAERIAAVETADAGTGYLDNVTFMVPRSVENIQFFADLALKINSRTISSALVENRVRYEPAGVSALITPWNGPFMLTTWKIGPCLAAGNTAVVKPPEWAPLACALLGELANEAGIPPGVLNIVQGLGSEAGDALVNHAGVRRISFTGSPATARVIGKAAAERLVPTSFELGGKSANIIFADADMDLALQHALIAFFRGGQGCTNGTRLLVEASVADEFYRRFIDRLTELVPADPRNERGLSPSIHPVHLARVQGFIDRAASAGIEIACGGEPFGTDSLYFKPTVVVDPPMDSEIVQSEVFGPVVTWHVFESEDSAVELANATDYGLSAEVFTQDEDRAARVASQVRAGMVWVNCFMIRDLATPFGGLGLSGIGREGGEWSFDFFCDVKNVAIRKGIFVSS